MGEIKDKRDPRVILATDCGSTTTKARLFKKLGDEYRFVSSGEAPTTVEEPYEDVTLGVCNAVREIEELTGHKLLSEKGTILLSEKENVGVDLYITTSSAGGGLQMVVLGVIKTMTAESAERAALGAGGIVMDVFASDDGRPDYKKISKVRGLRPDIVLLAGGTDGGDITHVTEMAELLAAANPTPRLGEDFQLPIIFAGNKDAIKHVQKILQNFSIKIVDNLRPKVDIENLIPSREAVQECFMEHVMSHAPGYNKLMKWTEVPIMPTPMAEGDMMKTLAKIRNENVIGVGLGGATTNVYSIFNGNFVRTVSANLGMSYSIRNVLKETGIDNIRRWLPFEIETDELADVLSNKMIRPTIIPQTIDYLMIEHAVAREAIRWGFAHHKLLARGLRGVTKEVTIGDLFERGAEIETYIDLLKVHIILGTGGLLSRAPRRSQSCLILIDAFQPEGVTRLAQDSVFMIPHLGILSTVHPKIAYEIFNKDCLVRLGTCIAPSGQTLSNEGVVKIELSMPDGSILKENVEVGSLKVVKLEVGKQAKANIYPPKGWDLGKGPGSSISTLVEGGVVGLVIDARGRPLTTEKDEVERKQQLIKLFESLNMYPKEYLEKLMREVG